ncbi:S8 family serine peptidase, partial [Singulisphaera rosea]
TAEDSFGNLTSNFNGKVTVALAANPTGATLAGTLIVQAVNGVATFSGLSIAKAGVGYTLKATSGTFAAGTSATFNVIANSATQVAFSTQPPASATAGKGFGTTIAVEDSLGNVATSYNGKVTIALAGNPTGTTLGGTLTLQAVNGIATFSGLAINKVGTGYSLKATSGSLTAATSAKFNVVPADAAQIVAASQPASTVAGKAFGITFVALDSFGNRATTFNGKVTIVLAGGTSGASLGGTLTIQAVNGVAAFSSLSIKKSGVGYTLKATSGSLSTTSAKFNVLAADASQLVVSTQPASTTAGKAFGLSISVQDGFGNLASTFNGKVTLTLASNPSGATLSGTLIVQVVNGVASFSGLSINKKGTGYTLKATSGSLAGATSASFNIT